MLFGHYKFQFTRGECRVTPSKIYLPCDEADRLVEESPPGQVRGYLLIGVLGMSILFFYAAFKIYHSGHWVFAFLTFSLAVGLAYKVIFLPKDYLPLCEISKDEVTKISVSHGDGPYPRPRITIHVTRHGRERVARLEFTYRSRGGDEEVAKALEVFKEQDWEVKNEE